MKKHAARKLGPIPGLKPHVKPYRHQVQAAGVIMDAGETDFKGLILADPSGLGKTLSALMPIASAVSQGSGPAVVVAPASCCLQWMHEIDELFDKVRSLPLNPPSIHGPVADVKNP